MKTIKDYDAEYTVYEHGTPTKKMRGNIWAWQETFRQVFGPGSHAEELLREWQGRAEIIVDPVDWGNPTCCEACKAEAKRINQQ
jgi:hypothetical protein